ncbi:DUF6069 family protein [Actinomadura xylanilytica]|uniref:DUF6069 family protein n=1 Tax=Actinomadura xylanilytica TaxID=887459 RepID=UPI00255AAD76|nr:DUF6069 family protein [Actinomadura xylanilytica]MDL4776673.1 DUF6069 family protein [Actinomadura xylanilytica]
MSSRTTPVPAAPGRVRRTAGRRALAVAGAAAASLALWALAGPVAGVDLTVRSGGADQAVGAGTVAVAGLLAGLAGWALLAALERLVSRPGPVWTAAAVVVLAFSLAGPLGSGAGAASVVALAGMHLVVAAVLVPCLGRSAHRR